MSVRSRVDTCPVDSTERTARWRRPSDAWTVGVDPVFDKPGEAGEGGLRKQRGPHVRILRSLLQERKGSAHNWVRHF